jgi:hypothetical protein
VDVWEHNTVLWKWEHNTVICKWILGSTVEKKLKKAKVGLLKKDVLELHVHGE